jgi:UDP-N-acetylmuramyl pentapeptide phosphotransferase/UDP-N-acetylglucosamine-1-phosphate transferase
MMLVGNRSEPLAIVSEAASSGSLAMELLLTNVSFALEEYKAVQEKIKNGRDTLTKLETVTIGGVAVAVGVLLGIGHTETGATPLFAWWSAVFILVAAFVRCLSYYVYIPASPVVHDEDRGPNEEG